MQKTERDLVISLKRKPTSNNIARLEMGILASFEPEFTLCQLSIEQRLKHTFWMFACKSNANVFYNRILKFANKV